MITYLAFATFSVSNNETGNTMQSNIFELPAVCRGTKNARLLAGLKAALTWTLSEGAADYPSRISADVRIAAHQLIDAGGRFDEALAIGLKLRGQLREAHDQRVTAMLNLVSARAWKMYRNPGQSHRAIVDARRAIEAGATISDVMEIAFGFGAPAGLETSAKLSNP